VEQYFQTVRVQKGQSHVVVCGTVTERGLHRFLKQLFHPNHRNTRSMIVVRQRLPDTVSLHCGSDVSTYEHIPSGSALVLILSCVVRCMSR
jgi:hypothetical protein